MKYPADIMYKSGAMKNYRRFHITDSTFSETENFINGLSYLFVSNLHSDAFKVTLSSAFLC